MAEQVSKEDSYLSEPSWKHAYQIAQDLLQVPSTVRQFVRSAWTGSLTPDAAMKLLSFSRFHLPALLEAAELGNEESPSKSELVERSLGFLGLKYSAAVLGINYCCRAALLAQPPPIWKGLFHEMMTHIEIGYKFGAKVADVGLEVGSVAGFSQNIGLAILLAKDPKGMRTWRQVHKKDKEQAKEMMASIFGCEAYQVSASVLQQVGFGAEAAVGTGLASGNLDPKEVTYSAEILRWKAAFHWVYALRSGLSYPGNLESRNLFPEVIPAQPSQNRNVILEVLHTEVAKIKDRGSDWTWHLPRKTYELTEEFLASKK